MLYIKTRREEELKKAEEYEQKTENRLENETKRKEGQEKILTQRNHKMLRKK